MYNPDFAKSPEKLNAEGKMAQMVNRITTVGFPAIMLYNPSIKNTKEAK
jgi:hypothetical protein